MTARTVREIQLSMIATRLVAAINALEDLDALTQEVFTEEDCQNAGYTSYDLYSTLADMAETLNDLAANAPTK